MSGQVVRATVRQDYQFAGDGTLTSAAQNATTKLNGVPASLPVYVFEASTFQIAYFFFSEADGTWQIDNISTDFEFIAIARDTTKVLNSACCDWMQPT